jgi:hypothetical protein
MAMHETVGPGFDDGIEGERRTTRSSGAPTMPASA